MKPHELVLCVEPDCEEIWAQAKSVTCPSCGSSSAVPVSRMLRAAAPGPDHLAYVTAAVARGERGRGEGGGCSFNDSLATA